MAWCIREVALMSVSTQTGTSNLGSSSSVRSDGSRPAEQIDEALCSTPGVQEVCAVRGVGPQLLLAARLARQAFGQVHEMHSEVDVDPDTDERRIVLDVTVDAPVDELLRRYANYTRDWVAAAPAETREWVRLAFHPLRDA
jgi:hypothetical protein